jgi:Cu(I)/Ag(I) efflux system membrane fusion protein
MLEPRLVTLGTSTVNRIEIVSGLSVGDTVVASATFLVDAESNLGTLLGGMGNMPGMDMTAPKKPEDSSAHTSH